MQAEDLEVQKRIEKAKKCESILDNIYNGIVSEISEHLFPKRAIPNAPQRMEKRIEPSFITNIEGN
jgi:hypothetical protein